MIVIFLVFTSLSAKAEWLVTVNRTGYFGQYALGGIYEWNPRHSFELSIGTYTVAKKDFHQSNMVYRYSQWEKPWNEKVWRPLQVGVFMIRSWDQENYFIVSPSKYPSANYYDETVLRWGLELGSTLALVRHNLEIAYQLRILDYGLMAAYNNAHKDLQYYISSGTSLRYRF